MVLGARVGRRSVTCCLEARGRHIMEYRHRRGSAGDSYRVFLCDKGRSRPLKGEMFWTKTSETSGRRK